MIRTLPFTVQREKTRKKRKRNGRLKRVKFINQVVFIPRLTCMPIMIRCSKNVYKKIVHACKVIDWSSLRVLDSMISMMVKKGGGSWPDSPT
jgi:hypothetical protein